MAGAGDQWGLLPLMVVAVALTLGHQAHAAKRLESKPGTAQQANLDAKRGWHFYRESVEEEEIGGEQEGDAAPTPSASASSPKAAELLELQALQRHLQDLRGIAVMRPTEVNVRRYMELEASVVRRASYFADMAQRVAWTRRELDMTLEGRPVNAQAIDVFDRQQMSERGAAVQALGRDHVLLFFFRSDCPYCHAFAPTLSEFSARYGLSIVAISMDGQGLTGFPDFRIDNGISRTLRVATVPTLLLARPATGQIQPVGYGTLSQSQLLERLTAILRPIMPPPAGVSLFKDPHSRQVEE